MRPARPIVMSGLLVLGGLALVAVFAVPRFRSTQEPAAATNPPVGGPVLYCEFYNFVGRAPKVGFTFGMVSGGRGAGNAAPVFTQTDQIEADGTRAGFADAGVAPVWSFTALEDPAVLTSPDGAIRINLYGYDPARRGATWFEAGLRSVQYLNLDGKCRQSGV
ncbi:hypothetical protein [Methylobacterium sp. J-068]|uniref:hypothetical protein n=1 Tax=Methylobacterium sp. J-068 TaxID=2836649 RepID=UPI001FBBBD56|nr:hypothetical protein [Methylobacterium sp. J-068]MCJ2036699.1 hypothetical protein [Methylobacterium sp. J-068]